MPAHACRAAVARPRRMPNPISPMVWGPNARNQFVERGKNWRADELAADSDLALLIWVRSGRVLLTEGPRSETLLESDCAMLVATHKSVSVEPAPQASVVICTLSLDNVEGLLSSPSQGIAVLRCCASHRLCTLFQVGLTLCSPQSDLENRLRSTLAKAISQTFAVDICLPPSTTVPEPARQAKHFMDLHFAETCDLTRVVSAAGVARQRLVSTFKRQYGVTPTRYLWDLRIGTAVNLIRTTPMILAEVAANCGFKSQYHLSREVKRATGLSPRAHRQCAHH